MNITFSNKPLDDQEQDTVSAGFEQHSQEFNAPSYEIKPLIWRLSDTQQNLVGVLTAKELWNWIYIDELWISESQRNVGLGKQLMYQLESYALEQHCKGLWLWTQSWQAENFYIRLGFEEFCRFPDFPLGHERIGLRKFLN